MQKRVIGDVLIRNIGVVKHFAIYAGVHCGIEYIAENQIGYGVRYITLEEFLKEGRIVKERHFNFSTEQQNATIIRINQRIGREYKLLGYNCEDFVNDVLTGKRGSSQVDNAFIGLAVVAVVGWTALVFKK